MGGLAAAHAVGQQQARRAARLKGRRLIAAQCLAFPGPQGDGGAAGKARRRRHRHAGGQNLRHLGVLLPRHLIRFLQLEPVSAAQQELVQLVVQRLQQLGEVQAAAGKMQGEVLCAGAAAAQQAGAGVVEGIVGIVVVCLPAIPLQ